MLRSQYIHLHNIALAGSEMKYHVITGSSKEYLELVCPCRILYGSFLSTCTNALIFRISDLHD